MSATIDEECRQETDFAHAAAVATEIAARAKHAKMVVRSGELSRFSLRQMKSGKIYALFMIGRGPSSQIGFAFSVAAIEALNTIGVGGGVEVIGLIEEAMVIKPDGSPKVVETYRAHTVRARALPTTGRP